MNWSVETLNRTVDAELVTLPADMRARFIWISKLITEHGLPNVGEPYVKHIDVATQEQERLDPRTRVFSTQII